MRLPRLLCATAVTLIGGLGIAAAQAPAFQMGPTGSDIPTRISPTQQQGVAAGAAANLSPNNPATGAPAGGPAPARARPLPFDVNNDGRTPSAELPDDTPMEFVQPSTTVSPLAPGQRGTSIPVDATSEQQRGDLAAMLHENTRNVREFRVQLDDAAEFPDALVDRPIVPQRTLRLEGELDSQAWNVYLTAAEAARGGTLSVAFNNSVLVLPEGSRLRLYLNGRQIMETAIDSPDRTKVVTLPIDPDLLRAGDNTFRIVSEMRHRIDCSVNATYELWTRIDTRLTGFSAEGLSTPVGGLPDLPAIGVGTNGATRLRVVMDEPTNPRQIDRMLKVVQAVALRGRFRQPLVEVVAPGSDLEPAVGTINIVLGPAATVARVLSGTPSGIGGGPTVDLVNDDIGPTIVISGPSTNDVETALGQFVSGDATAATRSNGPMIDGATTITLADVGFGTIDFSGRRFRAGFNVTLPPDFYAAAYGEAKMLLDAAYSEAIDQNSQLVIYVNGVSSTSVNFASADGRVFRDYPVALGMQSFKPGVNRIELVAELRSDDDAACLPGATAASGQRFAILASTQLVFPNFARIGQLPNLASFAANGFPYELDGQPVRVMLGGASLDTIGAAGTLMSRIAVNRGSALDTGVAGSIEQSRAQGLIVIAPLAEVPQDVLQVTGAQNVIPGAWDRPRQGNGADEPPQGLEQYDEVLARLRRQLRQEDAQLNQAATNLGDPAASLAQRPGAGANWYDVGGGGEVSSFLGDLLRPVRNAFNLDFNFTLFSDGTSELTRGSLPDDASLMLVQAPSPENKSAAWTLITSPSASLLSTSIAAISAPDAWDQISGRATAFSLETNQVDTVRASHVDYIATLPLSFTNMRLIAANWFSINNGVYAIAVVFAAFLLGCITWVLVRPLGRKN